MITCSDRQEPVALFGNPIALFVGGRGQTEKSRSNDNNTKIKRIIKDYDQQIYANKMDNLEEMDQFLEKYNLPKLNQEETTS